MQKVYEVCFYGGLVLAIVSLIVAVVLFVVLKIPKVFGELTGRAAKKSMKEMKEGGVKSGGVAKKEQEKYYNMGTGKITAKDAVSMDVRKANRDDSTELLDREKGNPDTESTDILRAGGMDDEEATAVLSGHDEDEATDILTSDVEGDDGATDVLTSDVGDDGATDVLTSDVGDDGATDVLTADVPADREVEEQPEEKDEKQTEDETPSGDEKDTELPEQVEEIPPAEEDEEGTSILSQDTADAMSKRVRFIYNVVVVHTDEKL